MKYNDFEQRVVQQYTTQTKKNGKQISPAVIAMIIDIALKLLANCGNFELRKRPIITRVLIRQNMSRAELSRPDANDIVETIAELAEGATVDEIRSIVSMNLE